MSERRWIVSQIGAREHYAIPRALNARDRLAHLFTDAWCSHGRSVLRRLPNPLRSFANRFHPDLEGESVMGFTGWAIWHRFRSYVQNVEPGSVQYYEHHRQIGADFARRVRKKLEARSSLLDGTVYFGYNTGCLETLELLEDKRCLTIVDQIDPGRVHKEIVREEARRWPNWSTQVPVFHEPYENRIQKEWEKASVIVVNSEWSKRALIQQNVPASKIEVVPLAYEPSSTRFSPRNPDDQAPLHVLWLGSVLLAKGIPYLMEAARKLEEAPIRFSIVGPIHITEQAVSSAPSNVTFVGRVPRDETADWYRRADVFVLPTLSDGFAITQIEAMAHGLPVIATPNCGRVVTEGEDGFLVPPRDVDALVDALTTFIDTPSRIGAMSKRALETSQTFTLDRVASRLIDIARTYT